MKKKQLLNKVMSSILALCFCLSGVIFANSGSDVSALMEDSYYKKTYGVTYNELLTKYPQYLNNNSFNMLMNIIDGAVYECVDGFASPDDTFSAWVSGLKNGLISFVPGYPEYKNRQIMEKTTQDLVNKISGFESVSEDMDKIVKDVKESYYTPLKNIDDVDKYLNKAALMQDFSSSRKYMSSELVEEYIDEIFKHENDFIKYAGNSIKIYEWVIIFLAFEEIDYNTTYELYQIAPEHSSLKQGLEYQLENWKKDRVQTICERALNKKLLSKISSYITEAGIKGIFAVAGTSVAGVSISFGTLFWDIMVEGMEWSSAEDVAEATMSYAYAYTLANEANAQRVKMCMGNTSENDVHKYELLVKAEIAAYNCAMKNAEKITTNKTMKGICQDYLAWFDCGSISYDTYIEWCMKALKADVDAGNLVLDSAEDEEALAAKSERLIQERFASFQSAYPVGSVWTDSYKGGIQCYGFAKMCFDYIFGVEIPCYDWYNGKRYQFTPSDAVVAVGQLTGYSSASAADAKALFAKGKLGDVIQACGGGDSQHTMIFVAAHDNGVEVYDCNVDNMCGISQYVLSYEWIANNYCTNGTSLAGVTIYRAYNYAKLLGTTAFEIIDDSANFVIDENGVLTKYKGYASIVVIPDEVTAIGDKAFQNNKNVHFVRMNDNVKSIGQYAFDGCSNLIDIQLPDSITTIKSYAFRNCTSLASVKVPEPIETINTGTWSGCSSIVSLSMSDNVIKINYNAFAYCSNLSTVTLSKSLESIGNSAFRDCDKIIEIEIPKSLIYGGEWDLNTPNGAFYDCSGLKNVTFEKGTTRVASYLFAGCDGLEEIILPETITTIQTNAFKNCTNLTKVILSENLLTIGSSAFYKCSNLKSIIIPDNVTQINVEAFAYCSNLSSVTLSKSLESIKNHAFRDCDKITEIEIPKSLIYGGEWDLNYPSGAFYECSGLKDVTFEKGTTRVAAYLFNGCDGLEKITLPDTITIIEDKAFYNCKSLHDVEIADSITTINQSAFSNCTALEEIHLPDSITSMGEDVFSGCTNLKKANIPSKRVNLMKNTFYNCKSLEAIEIPDSVTNIQDQAFYGCKSLTKIEIPEGVTSIGNKAFYDCEALETVILPDGLKTLGTECFRDCILLENVTIGTGITTIPASAFRGTNIESITLPSTVTKINDYAFAECVNLKTIVIPQSVTSISSTSVFSYPKKMTIYGVKGSYAETYANDKGITFVELDSNAVVNDEYNISVAPVDGSLMPGLTLSVVPVGLDADITSKVEEAVLAYDIKLMNGTKEVQPNGTVKVTIPVPNGKNGSKLKIFRKESNGNFTDMNAVYDSKTNTLIFTTNSLGIYVLAESKSTGIFGDINDDGEFDMDDVIDLARSVLFTTPGSQNPYLAAADLDKNGEIDMDDVILLTRKLILG